MQQQRGFLISSIGQRTSASSTLQKKTMHSLVTSTAAGQDLLIIVRVLQVCIYSGIKGDILILEEATVSCTVISTCRVLINYKCHIWSCLASKNSLKFAVEPRNTKNTLLWQQVSNFHDEESSVPCKNQVHQDLTSFHQGVHRRQEDCIGVCDFK